MELYKVTESSINKLKSITRESSDLAVLRSLISSTYATQACSESLGFLANYLNAIPGWLIDWSKTGFRTFNLGSS